MHLSLARQIVLDGRLDAEIARRAEKRRLESSLIEFIEAAWPSIDGSQYKPSWAIDALCDHLQAVTEGKISRLLVNFPPRCAKTLITSVCWPAWTWARRERNYRSGPGVKFLCASYGHGLSLTNSNLTRRLILSPWYQSRWGDGVTLREDQNTKAQFDTDQGGSRLSTSVGGTLLGVGGDIIVVDDPHNTEGVESEAERETVIRWWAELSTTRLNDPKRAAIVVIMQRLHEEDLSGKILSSDEHWDHLMIPMQFEPSRLCTTSLGWQDPRGLDDGGEPLDGTALDERQGQLMWPERFGAKEVSALKAGLGPYMSSGRLQQSPVPRGGGIFERSWWQLWESADGRFPAFDRVIASLDGAFTENEENDPSALTVWGTFLGEDKRVKIMLINAWAKHLKFSAPRIERISETTIIDGRTWHPDIVLAGMSADEVKRRNALFRRRCEPRWGLIEHVAHSCRQYRVDTLLIEAAGPGLSAAEELRNRYGGEAWSVQVQAVRGDKVSRALAVQAVFASGRVYAPDRDWADAVITEMATFPKARHDDLTDSSTQAVSYLRRTGLAQSDDEYARAELEAITPRRQLRSIYPC